jgi:hypothetical protein
MADTLIKCPSIRRPDPIVNWRARFWPPMGRNGANAPQPPCPAAKLVVDQAGSMRLHRTVQEHGERRGMLPLYAARLEDLGSGDFVKVDCAACHHVALLTAEALLRPGLNPAAKVLDLKGRFRCRGCGRKGRAVVSVKWRGGRGRENRRRSLSVL